MNDLTRAEVYDAAADYIEVHGWRRMGLRSPTGEVCIVGAIGMALDPALIVWEIGVPRPIVSDAVREIWFELNSALGHYLPGAHINPVTWNNYSAKDAAEVIDVLRGAAKDLRNNA
jgi:hypothetical protein